MSLNLKFNYTLGFNARFKSPLYIHNWPLNLAFSQDYDLASHTAYVVSVNFIYEWRLILYKVDSERNF